VLELLPTGALSTGLRTSCSMPFPAAFPAGNTITLAVWAVVAITFAARRRDGAGFRARAAVEAARRGTSVSPRFRPGPSG
jgi:hypothetical protein